MYVDQPIGVGAVPCTGFSMNGGRHSGRIAVTELHSIRMIIVRVGGNSGTALLTAGLGRPTVGWVTQIVWTGGRPGVEVVSMQVSGSEGG